MANPVNQIMVMFNQNPMVFLIGGAALFGLILLNRKFGFLGGSSGRSVENSIEPHDRVPLEQKTKPFYEQKLIEDGMAVDMPIKHGMKHLGVVSQLAEVTVASELISTDEKQSYGDDEEDEDEDIEVYVLKIQPSSKVRNAISVVKESLGAESERQIRIIRKEWIKDTGSSVHIPSDVEFVNMGGLEVEKSFAGINMVSDVILMKSLERNLNNIEEYVKRINHWSDNYSQDMGRYEKEIEADERRYGNKLNNR